MTTTYSVVCDDCKVRIEAGYTSQGGILRGIDKDWLIEEILNEHIGHHVRFLCDLADDELSESYIDKEVTE